MPSVTLSPLFNGVQIFAQGTNTPLNGGLLNTYAAGSATPVATYSESSGTTLNANPIQLGPDGRIPSELWLIAGTAYKLVLTDSLGANAVTFDNILGMAGASASFTSITASGAGTFGSLSTATLTTTGDNNGPGLTISRAKAATTSRSSTITPTDDPELIAPLGLGTWSVEVLVFVGTGAGVGYPYGFQAQLGFSGTLSDGTLMASASGTLVTVGQVAFATGIAQAAGTSGVFDWFLLKGSCIVTAAGNISLKWAQNSSGSQALHFQAGSYMNCTRVA